MRARMGANIGIVEIVAVDVGAHVDAAHAGLLGDAVELVDGPVAVEHRQRGQHDEAVGVGLVRGDRRRRSRRVASLWLVSPSAQ